MIPVFLEAALRSFLAGMAVAVGLRLFRVRNVLAQKAAWGLVLVSALAMPLLLPVTAKWHLAPTDLHVVLPAQPMTLLEELQARILAQGGSQRKINPSIAAIPQNDSPQAQEAAAQEPATADGAGMPTSGTAGATRGAKRVAAARFNQSAQPVSSQATAENASPGLPIIRDISISPATLVLLLYSSVTAFFLLRLALGLWTTFRLWRAAQPVAAAELGRSAESLALRASSHVASPVTVGSAVLLPADYRSWNNEKLRIVLAHERSHIRQCDFYLQVLASLYAALVWFSPLGWWLKHELAELAEAISDRAAMTEASSDTLYAQILLEFAAAPRKTQIGVAMARPGSLSRRIERLFNDHFLRQCFAGGRRALVAAALLPVALIASTMLVHVDAATGSRTPAPLTIATLALPAATPNVAAPEVSIAAPAGETVAAAVPSPETPATPSAGAIMQESSGLSFDRTLSASENSQLTVKTGSGNIHITRGSGNQVHIHGQIRVSHEGSEEQARQIAANPPIVQEGNAITIGRHEGEQWHGISIDYQIEAPAGVVLDATSGSGNIEDEGVGQNAKLQTGSGDITATSLEGPFKVMTGSGNIVAAQTGEGDVYAQTGSGNLEIKDIHGSFRGQTGSGDIKASGTPSANWDLQTGSGNIDLTTGNAPLTLDASTGSGSVATDHEMAVQGSLDRHHIRGNLNGGGPTVRVQTGSGDVHIH